MEDVKKEDVQNLGAEQFVPRPVEADVFQSVEDDSQPEKQRAPPVWWVKFKSFLLECRRVLKITKKPSKEEFKTIVKVSGLGIIIIGLVGFIINVVATFMQGA
jgi:protein transport protein SEC61 subunit gamma-like protein